MDYFNLARFLKNVVFNFMRMFKYLSISLICICFIAVCLLLMSTKGECAGFREDYSSSIKIDFSVDDTVLSKFNSTEYADGNYLYLIFNRWVSFQGMYCDIYVVPRSTGATQIGVYNYSSGTLSANSSITDWYKTSFSLNSIPASLSFTHYTSSLSISPNTPRSTDTSFGNPSYVVRNLPLWTSYDSLIFSIDNSSTRFHFPNELLPPFTAPSFMPPNFNDSLQYLETGEFIAFQIDPR